ncbi:MAG: T9SS type A sorting domain-containing protein [Crocinitomicaceae bacterium]|nr:T9SS type A sorting domain-containing protein [Flavobacteriales bacterium]NQZ36158.1 T9SS type A sorting domain-containing protein [Crocinitomicaceae bacterium]
MKQSYLRIHLGRVALIFVLFLVSNQVNAQLYSFTTHTFTPSGALGRTGPLLIDCQTEYTATTWASNPAYFSMATQGIQQWVVPETGSYSIETIGGEGGTGFYEHGQGASIYGEFSLTQGDTLFILVGQAGEDDITTFGGGGGGGCSFVWGSGSTLYSAAAGGGGGSDNQSVSVVSAYIDGQETELVVYNTVAGSGGAQGTSPSWFGGGGTGWNSNGIGLVNVHGEGGKTPANGGFGGYSYNSDPFYAEGGFGGGGGSGHDAGGGGGGYTGGNGGSYSTLQEHAGGGGSFNSGTNQTNQTGTNNNDGRVVITILCSPLTTSVSSTEVCDGDLVTLSATGNGTITWNNGVVNGVAFANPIGTTTYVATSSDGLECGFSIDIITNALPVVMAMVNDSVICLGDSVILSGSGAASYTWDNGVTDSVYFIPSSAGTTSYTVTGLDVNGCAGTDGINIFVSELTITALITNENLGGDGEIDLTVTGGTGSYIFTWDSGPTSEDITGLNAGTYTVNVDDGACIADTTFTISNVASLFDNVNSGLAIYPNPTEGTFTITLDGNFEYQIVTVNGKVILTGSSIDSANVDLVDLSTGIYFVRLTANGAEKMVKMIKK